METFVVNGLAYDIIDADKKEVQVHWPDLGYVGKFCTQIDLWAAIRSKRPTGILGIPENVVNPKDGISYTVVAVGGTWTVKYQTFDNVEDKRTKLGYKEVNVQDIQRTVHGLSRSRISGICLPNSIRELGYCALDGNEITEISFPKGLTKFGFESLSGSTKLTKIAFPNGVTEIPGECCYFCVSLKEVEIPSSVKVIEGYAFANCDNLKKVIIPSSVDLIEGCAFKGCDGLKEAIIYNNDGVITIENGAFPSETKITYKSGILSKLLGK